MKTTTYLLLSFFSLLLLTFTAQGQNSINGKVVDATTGEGLIGATVVVSGTTKGMVTDLDGRFVIGGVSGPNVKLEASFVGYEKTTIDVAVNGGSNRITIKLNESSTQLETVVVEGIVEGQIASMITMKKAENIKNVVSAEQIVTFPDLNAAEVMQRIPGITLQRDQGEGRFVQLRGTPPELTNFNINGEQIPSPEGDFRYVGLDIIPSDQIESIEVTKVMTPDMDGDGIGGSVDVITKEAKSGPPQIRAVLASGYNNLRQTPIYNGQFSYGQRFNKFGFQVNASLFENNQGSDNIEYKFTKGPFFGDDSQEQGRDNFFLHYREAQLRHYDITRTRIAVSPTLDYKFNDHSKIYLKAMFNSFTDQEIRRRKVYDLEDPLTFNSFLFGGIEHDVRYRSEQQTLSTLSVGGEHTIGKVHIDYQMFVAQAGETIPDYFEARFENFGQAIRITFDDSDPDYPRATFPDPNNARFATDYESYEFDEMQIEQSEVRELLLTPRINVQIPYSFLNGQTGYLKFGGKIRSRIKERDVVNTTYSSYIPEDNAIYPGTGDPLTLPGISGNWREDNLLNQNYALEYIPSPQKMLNHFEFNKQYYILNRNEFRKNSYNPDYTYSENIYAAYGMFRHNVNKLMILGGLRFERTDVTENTAYDVQLDGPRFIGIDTLSTTRVLDFWLPQLQLKYAITPNINLRGAITYTYSRPNYVDVISSREQDADELEVGNPNLDYPTSTNVDLMIERYFQQSIFSAGLFYKKIDDFVFSYIINGREGEPGSGNFPPFELTKPLNGTEADVFGAELQAQFKFKFLPGFLSNFGLYTNYTYTYSQAFLPERVAANYADAVILDVQDDLSEFFSDSELEEIPLPGQAQHTANFALFYDGPKFFARLTMNYQDDFLVEIGADPDLDEYYDAAFRLDYTMNYQINKYVTLFGDFINITNTPLRFYLSQENIVKQQEFYSWWIRIGARLNITD